MSSEPIIAEVYECTLNDGVFPDQVVAIGQGNFAAFAVENDLNMNTYLWEAVAINAPYDEADLRWINYFPTWKDQSKADRLWRQKADDLQAEIFELITCKKPFFFPMMSIAQPPQAQEKPLITQVCSLNDGKSIEDAVAYGERRCRNRQQAREHECWKCRLHARDCILHRLGLCGHGNGHT